MIWEVPKIPSITVGALGGLSRTEFMSNQKRESWLVKFCGIDNNNNNDKVFITDSAPIQLESNLFSHQPGGFHTYYSGSYQFLQEHPHLTEKVIRN